MLTLYDEFAGVGGSSWGATRVPGVEVILAANHWDLAVESHAANAVTPPVAEVLVSALVEAITGEPLEVAS